MPDSTTFLFDPTFSRAAVERGSGLPPRMLPQETAAPVSRSSAGANSTAGTQRTDLRWRDIQWVDFTSDPERGDLVPTSEQPRVWNLPQIIEPEPIAAELRAVLRHFAKRTGALPLARNRTVAGLPTRFTRIGVPRSTPGMRKTLFAPKPSRVLAKLTPIVELPILAWKTASQAPETPPDTVLPAVGSSPALARAPAASIPPTKQPLAIPPPFAKASGAKASGLPFPRLTANSATTGKAASIASPRRVVPREVTGERTSLAARVSPVVDRVRYSVGRKHIPLRAMAMVASIAIVVGVAVYGAGLLMTAFGSAPAGAAAKANPDGAKPNETDRQLAGAEKVMRPQEASLSTDAPPTDPAARAAFYLARAKAGDAAAEYDVGVLYARGDGLVQDYASAASWFHAAAAEGNVAAQYNLGVLYANGLGVAGDQTEALNWYRSAADQNHADAQFNLALAYAQGTGTAQDFPAAARWYQRAAQQGLVPAMVNLAILYEQGNGVTRSSVDAYAWYSASADRGDAGAKQRAGELFKLFGERDKARAQVLAATIAAGLGGIPTAARS